MSTGFVDAFIRVYHDRGIKLDTDAAFILARELVDSSGALDEHLLDRFQHCISEQGITHLDQTNVSKLITQLKSVEAERHIVPVAHMTLQVCRRTSKATAIAPHDKIRLAMQARCDSAIERIKQSPTHEWWAQLQTFDNKITVRPVESAIGYSGTQTILGSLMLTTRPGEVTHTIKQWALVYGTQTVLLDLSKAKIERWFIESNIVLAKGEFVENVVIDGLREFTVERLDHPPYLTRDDNDALLRDAELRHFLWENCRGVGLAGPPINRYAFVGDVDCSETSLNLLYNILVKEGTNLNGIVLFGAPFGNAADLAEYKEGFAELDQTIKMAKFTKQVILIPGFFDFGPRVYPKVPLPQSLLPPFVQGATNPVLLKILQPAILNRTLKTEVLVFNSDLLSSQEGLRRSIIPSYYLSEKNSSDISSDISGDYSSEAIIDLIYGQNHIYPVPLTGRPILRIDAEYDTEWFSKKPLEEAKTLIIGGLPSPFAKDNEKTGGQVYSTGSFRKKGCYLIYDFLTGIGSIKP